MDNTLTLKVPGMTCGHCQSAVSSAVGALEGVRSVTVDLDTKIVVVDGEQLDRAAVVAAIDDAGFDVAES